MSRKLPKFATTRTPWQLLWVAPDGEVTGACFNSWNDLEAFSRACIKRGLCPWVPSSTPTPYDQAKGVNP
jgi:hypothetical protein